MRTLTKAELKKAIDRLEADLNLTTDEIADIYGHGISISTNIIWGCWQVTIQKCRRQRRYWVGEAYLSIARRPFSLATLEEVFLEAVERAVKKNRRWAYWVLAEARSYIKRLPKIKKKWQFEIDRTRQKIYRGKTVVIITWETIPKEVIIRKETLGGEYIKERFLSREGDLTATTGGAGTPKAP